MRVTRTGSTRTVDILKQPSRYRKAILAFVIPFAGAVLVALQEGSPGGSDVTTAEWIGAVATAIVTGGTVFGVGNRAAEGEAGSPEVSEQGYTLVQVLIVVVLVILIVWLLLVLF